MRNLDTVYLFFNGDELDSFPSSQEDKWFNYPPGFEAVRLAVAAAESWKLQGWKVKRIVSTDSDFSFASDPSDWSNQLKGNQYPANRWDFWCKLRQIPFEAFPMLVTTIDVFNRGFKPFSFHAERSEVVSFQNPFSLATFLVTDKQAAIETVNLILDYDNGKFPPLPLNLVSDESILRHYGGELARVGEIRMGYYGTPDGKDKPLIHIARNLCANIVKELPTV